MLSVLIIEDELPNAARLKKLLLQLGPDIHIVGELQSIRSSIAWLQKNQDPDVICMDIKLTDGLSFEIFEHVEVRSQVIFTTAYDEYALRAFQLNGVGYLLKPIQANQLEKSITKARNLVHSSSQEALIALISSMRNQEKIYRSRFLVNYRNKFIPLQITAVAYFFTEHKNTFLCTHEGKHYVIDQTLEELEQELDPVSFFRITRQYIVFAGAISMVHQFFNGRLKVDLQPGLKESLVVSRQKSISLRKWLNGMV